MQSDIAQSLTLQASPKPHPVGRIRLSSQGSKLNSTWSHCCGFPGWRAEQSEMGWDRTRGLQNRGSEGWECQTWRSRTPGKARWVVSESDPPAEQILGTVRPHMKVQKSRAPATGWAW